MKFYILFIFVYLFCFYSYSQEKNKLRLICERHEKKNEDGLDNIIIKTCYLKSFKFVSIGSPDYKGRYFWDYEVYKLVKKKYIIIKNSDIFINIKRLEDYVNSQIKKSYELDKKMKNNKECVSFIRYKAFTIDEMGIDFDEQKNIVFNVSFELPSACLNVDRSIISLSLDQIKPYLK